MEQRVHRCSFRDDQIKGVCKVGEVQDLVANCSLDNLLPGLFTRRRPFRASQTLTRLMVMTSGSD
jgi:hypothetical protein